jgi:DNA modification methylase
MKAPVISSKIELIDAAKLIPYARNSRTHSDDQVQQIASSIKEFGFTNPILISETDDIIAGHGRLLAAKFLGITEVPCIRLAHLNEQQRKAYVIADNKLALNAGWDDELLALELGELKDAEFDLNLTGFSEDELANLLIQETEEGLTDEDAVPEEPETPVSVEGDVWVLGNHRLMCGDSTSIDAVERLTGGQKVDMIFTDPPYGMSYGGGRARGDHSLDKETGGVNLKAHGEIIGDNLQGDDLLTMVRDAIATARSWAKDGGGTYVCFTWRTYAEFEAALQSCGLEVKNCIVWDKKSIGLGNSHYRPQHEFIFYCGGEWHGDKSESDVWYMSRGSTGDYVHPTQKPVELIERAINNSSKSGDSVIDSFGGSGSTLIACEKLHRHARLMELDPKYCDVTIKRWQDFTGQQAFHQETGKTLKELEKESTRT